MKEPALYAGAAAVDSLMTTVWMACTLLAPRLLRRVAGGRLPGGGAGRGPGRQKGAEGPAATDSSTVDPLGLGLLLFLAAGGLWASEWAAAEMEARFGWSVPSILVLTTIALLLAQVRPVQRVEGAGALGMFAVYLFLAVIGALCDLEALREIGQVGVTLAVFATVLILVAAWRLRERTELLGRGGASPWRSFRDVLANPHSRILIGVFFLEQLGFGALVALIPYLSDYVLETPGSTGIYLFGAIGAALLSIPVWINLSRRIGKIRIWRFSLVAKTFLFATAFLVGAGDFVPMLIIATLFGVMHGCGSVVGPSLKADVVDWDEAETGERKEGAYFAAWNFVQKGAGGVAVWAIGVMLAMTGFVPNAPQSGETLLGIRALASLAPSLLHVLALILMLRFSLDEAAHIEARQRADQRLAHQ